MPKIFLHDYGGHAFTAQLARALAVRGYDVLYVYSRATAYTPKGNLAPRAGDPANLRLIGLDIGASLSVNSLLTRRFQDISFARKAAALLREFRPDVTLSSCAPPEVHLMLMRAARGVDARFIYWMQDLWSVGARLVLQQKRPILSVFAGYAFERLERRLLRGSDSVIAISQDFHDVALSLGADPAACHMVPNWGVIDELPIVPKDNPWSRRHGLHEGTCLLYAGTLGLKHDPAILLELAIAFRDEPRVIVVVISEGLGADALAGYKRVQVVDNLILLPYQPFERLPEVLATSDVLISVLQPEASLYSVPSKVLSYLCAGRPILLSMPARNPSARLVAEAKAGVCVDPGDTRAFVEAARRLVENATARQKMATSARRYAEDRFAVAPIATRFEKILTAPRVARIT